MLEQLSNRRDENEAAMAHTWAAVSFLLEDAAWCDWIYREFDGERIPRPLISRKNRFGSPYPDRISISPDPTDPTELETIGDSIRSAQHLILIVSPESASSPTLEEHRQLFRDIGGPERIIVLVVKGLPASPATEPGCQADEKWLPEWLAWRFENNAFQPASRSVPVVIDARMGIASLAEVRARLMAALLDIDREQFAELGFVTRPTSTLLEVPADLQRDSAEAMSPGALRFLEIADSIPEPTRHSPLPIWICGLGALAALLMLVWTPDSLLVSLPSRSSSFAPQAPDVDANASLVEVRTNLDAPFPPMRGEKARPESSETAVLEQE